MNGLNWVSEYPQTSESHIMYVQRSNKMQWSIFFFFYTSLVRLVFGFHVRFNRFIIIWQFSQLKRERLEISLFHFFCFYNCVDPKRTSHRLKLTPEALPPTQCFSTSDLFGFKDFFPFYTLALYLTLILTRKKKHFMLSVWNMLFS